MYSLTPCFVAESITSFGMITAACEGEAIAPRTEEEGLSIADLEGESRFTCRLMHRQSTFELLVFKQFYLFLQTPGDNLMKISEYFLRYMFRQNFFV